jgi:hypothetical protein
MKPDDELDEVAANVLILDGMDVPTAVAGSVQGRDMEAELSSTNVACRLSVLATLLAVLLLLFRLA